LDGLGDGGETWVDLLGGGEGVGLCSDGFVLRRVSTNYPSDMFGMDGEGEDALIGPVCATTASRRALMMEAGCSNWRLLMEVSVWSCATGEAKAPAARAATAKKMPFMMNFCEAKDVIGKGWMMVLRVMLDCCANDLVLELHLHIGSFYIYVLGCNL
jgi:hypothetical protein